VRLAPLVAILLIGCDAADVPFEARAVQARWDPASGDFWDLPLPSDLRAQADGTWDLEEWPGATEDGLVGMWLRAADRRLVGGWGVHQGAAIQLTGPIDPGSLPGDGAPTVASSSPVLVVDIDPASPERGRLFPLRPRARIDYTPFTPPYQLVAMPVWGHPRRANTRYALVVTDGVTDTAGAPLGRSREFHDAWEANPDAPDDRVEHLADARAAVVDLGLDPASVVAASVFTTIDPNAQFERLATFAEAQPTPELAEPWTAAERYTSYQVLEGRYRVPGIQGGVRPYEEHGEGLIVWGDDGAPVVQDTQDVRLRLALPTLPMPKGGFPLLIYLHGSGGLATQVLHRGPRPEVPDADPAEPGTGPAEWLARRGVASIGVDFPLHGDRSDPPDTTGLELYNLLGNIDATIDNFDWAAAELLLLSRFVLAQSIDPSLAPSLDAGGAPAIVFDPARLTALGQSMGTTLGVVWAGRDPRLQGAVWSGAGGILAHIAVTAVEPFELRPLLSARLGYGAADELTESHPLLHAFQALWDLVDPIAKASRNVAEPFEGVPAKDVLMTAGVVDGYFSPVSEAAMAAGLGIPRAGASVEPTLDEVLALAGIDPVPYPVSGNLGGRTAAAVQFEAPHTLGHYVVFNQEGARHQYTCFAATVGTAGGAVILEPGALDDPCE